MLAPTFHVMNFKAGPLQFLDRVADIVQFATREDVAHEGPLLRAGGKLCLAALGPARDSMIEKEAIRGEHGPNLLQVFGHIGNANVFVHADRRDLVELPVNVSIVFQLDCHLVAKALRFDTVKGIIVLFL